VARYVLDIKPSARKELENLSDSLIARLAPKIDGLAADPRPSGCRKLRGYKDFWRIRVGEYRVVYIIDDDRKMVSVTRVAHRRDVYE
jgi:mRNA interferase RelE/StbE